MVWVIILRKKPRMHRYDPPWNFQGYHAKYPILRIWKLLQMSVHAGILFSDAVENTCVDPSQMLYPSQIRHFYLF